MKGGERDTSHKGVSLSASESMNLLAHVARE